MLPKLNPGVNEYYRERQTSLASIWRLKSLIKKSCILLLSKLHKIRGEWNGRNVICLRKIVVQCVIGEEEKLLSQDQVRQIFFIHCRQVDVTQDGSLNDAWPHFFGAALTEVPERKYIKKMVEKLCSIFKIFTSQQLLFRPLLQSFPHQGVFPSMAAPPHKEKLNMKSKIS